MDTDKREIPRPERRLADVLLKHVELAGWGVSIDTGVSTSR